MKKLTLLMTVLTLMTLFLASFAQSRVGGGRSFGSRGARGFVSPRNNSWNRSFDAPRYSHPAQPTRPFSQPVSQPAGLSSQSSLLKSFGAGIAGGMIGNMLARTFGGGFGQGGAYGGPMGGGIGILEIILFGGLLFWILKGLMQKTEVRSGASQTSEASHEEGGAAALMRKARSASWLNPSMDSSRLQKDSSNREDLQPLDLTPINTDLAMDLFFKIQGAWAQRDLTGIQHILTPDAREYLEKEIARLKSTQQINRLENIAVRTTEVTDGWRESHEEYCTVRILANLLDFTIDENTQQLLEGSKTESIKFEEYWTFSREVGTSTWKLSAIQQS